MAHKENKYCPFKKTVSMGYTTDGKKVLSDKFCRCAGAKCMAYINGECLRLRDNAVLGLRKAR